MTIEQNSILLVHPQEQGMYYKPWKFDKDSLNALWDILHEISVIRPFWRIEKNSLRVKVFNYFSNNSTYRTIYSWIKLTNSLKGSCLIGCNLFFVSFFHSFLKVLSWHHSHLIQNIYWSLGTNAEMCYYIIHTKLQNISSNENILPQPVPNDSILGFTLILGFPIQTFLLRFILT